MPRKVIIPTAVDEPSSNDKLLTSSRFLEMLNNLYPGKINFSIRESAKVLNLSYDFVREKIAAGFITAAKFGDRYMITVWELERILSQGVK